MGTTGAGIGAAGGSVEAASPAAPSERWCTQAADARTANAMRARTVRERLMTIGVSLVRLRTSRSPFLAAVATGAHPSIPAHAGNPCRIKHLQITESALWAHPAITGSSIIVKDVDNVICWSF